MNKILVAILTYKSPRFLTRALVSLLNSKDRALYDIIVLDNDNGRDETPVICYDFGVQYFKRSVNSITGAYNQAIDYFLSNNYDYISFYCSDWVYSTGCFPEMVECLNKDEKYGCATALSNYCATSEQFLNQNSLDYLRSLSIRNLPKDLAEVSDTVGNVLYEANKGKITESQFFCIGFLCKRKMVEETGHFDERIQNVNDVAYSIQAFKKGWKSIVCHGAFLLHLEMHASWRNRSRTEHIESDKADRALIKSDEIYRPNDALTSHVFWESCLKGFYDK